MKTLLDLTERGTNALDLIERFGFLTTAQVETLLFMGTSVTPESRKVMTRRVLRSLLDANLVGRTPRLVGGARGGSTGHAYYVRKAGRRPPKGNYLVRHSVTVADVAIAFSEAALRNPGHELLTFEPEQRFPSVKLTPDAYLVYMTPGVEFYAFLEVELGTTGSRVFADKVLRYVRLHEQGTFDPWPKVLTVTISDSRARLLRTTAEGLRLPRTTAFAFATLERVRRDAIGAVWEMAGHGEQRFSLFRTEGEPR